MVIAQEGAIDSLYVYSGYDVYAERLRRRDMYWKALAHVCFLITASNMPAQASNLSETLKAYLKGNT